MRTMCPISHAAHLVFLVARRQSSSVQQFVHVLNHRHLDFLRCRRSVSAHSSTKNITKRWRRPKRAFHATAVDFTTHTLARADNPIGRTFESTRRNSSSEKIRVMSPIKHAILHGSRRNSVKISNNCYQHRLQQNNFSSNLNLNLKRWHYRDSFRCSKMPYTFNFSNRNLNVYGNNFQKNDCMDAAV